MAEVDLLTANYILDRVPQKQFLRWVEEIISPRWVQYINCIPLQYTRPDGSLYVSLDEQIIPTGTTSLSPIPDFLMVQ
jgi:hypothetical protein